MDIEDAKTNTICVLARLVPGTCEIVKWCDRRGSEEERTLFLATETERSRFFGTGRKINWAIAMNHEYLA
ncbi:hypothetical protein MATL_G00140000 [Megalops atlanticus]|uniref:Uncharacterized protein n=1 Tax=Megalops atlanticus TaxID=7932 RepID=A0A9D3T5W4_MEGAT|nr:hypothetical protein MATL_G00140000 [Megalops atlanticus]